LHTFYTFFSNRENSIERAWTDFYTREKITCETTKKNMREIKKIEDEIFLLAAYTRQPVFRYFTLI
jgi:hypothetical protein